MLNLKSISETLSLLGGVAMLAACGGSQAPVNASEVPAEPAKQTEQATAEAAGDEAASATPAEPSADAAPADAAKATADGASSATPAAASASAKKPVPAAGKKDPKKNAKGGKKAGAAASCGEGSCG